MVVLTVTFWAASIVSGFTVAKRGFQTSGSRQLAFPRPDPVDEGRRFVCSWLDGQLRDLYLGETDESATSGVVAIDLRHGQPQAPVDSLFGSTPRDATEPALIVWKGFRGNYNQRIRLG
jgi:hypothetical protein